MKNVGSFVVNDGNISNNIHPLGSQWGLTGWYSYIDYINISGKENPLGERGVMGNEKKLKEVK